MFANFPVFLLVVGATNKKTGKLTKIGISYIQIMDIVFIRRLVGSTDQAYSSGF